jgi:small nuclear ribonucleoprotein (snRNP)-like protein
MSTDAVEIVMGTLKGYDALMNLVLDDVSEVLRGMHTFCHSSDCYWI